jgi:hypothetical protein
MKRSLPGWVSVRTAERRITEIYAQLGAVSGFQAAHKATKQGWL